MTQMTQLISEEPAQKAAFDFLLGGLATKASAAKKFGGPNFASALSRLVAGTVPQTTVAGFAARAAGSAAPKEGTSSIAPVRSPLPSSAPIDIASTLQRKVPAVACAALVSREDMSLSSTRSHSTEHASNETATKGRTERKKATTQKIATADTTPASEAAASSIAAAHQASLVAGTPMVATPSTQKVKHSTDAPSLQSTASTTTASDSSALAVQTKQIRHTVPSTARQSLESPAGFAISVPSPIDAPRKGEPRPPEPSVNTGVNIQTPPRQQIESKLVSTAPNTTVAGSRNSEHGSRPTRTTPTEVAPAIVQAPSVRQRPFEVPPASLSSSTTAAGTSNVQATTTRAASADSTAPKTLPLQADAILARDAMPKDAEARRPAAGRGDSPRMETTIRQDASPVIGRMATAFATPKETAPTANAQSAELRPPVDADSKATSTQQADAPKKSVRFSPFPGTAEGGKQMSEPVDPATIAARSFPAPFVAQRATSKVDAKDDSKKESVDKTGASETRKTTSHETTSAFRTAVDSRAESTGQSAEQASQSSHHRSSGIVASDATFPFQPKADSVAQTTFSSPDPGSGTSAPLHEQVAMSLLRFPDGTHEVELKLSPDKLGALTIELKVGNGTMEATVIAQTDEARTVLLRDEGILRDALAGQGIDLASFTVSLGGGQLSDEQRAAQADRDPGATGRRTPDADEATKANGSDSGPDDDPANPGHWIA